MNSKTVVINQSNYIPWKGYFDLIAAADEFIIYDDMQFTRRDWRNRNAIKSPNGLLWLTVPVKNKGHYHQSIREIEIDGNHWAQTHWKSLLHNYKKAPYFEEVKALLEPIYLREIFGTLSDLNKDLIQIVCDYLQIRTKISNSSDYKLLEGKTERLVDLCLQAGATEYISGPAAKDYIDESVFSQKNLKLTWFDYEGYPEYPQLWGKFEHQVSIIDMLFNCGAGSYERKILRKVRTNKAH